MMKLVVLLYFTISLNAAFNAGAGWDIRTTGSNLNGGAYDATVASPGTDESQGSSGTAISITLTSTTAGTGSPVFSATTHGPGNFVHIASGAGCTTGWYEILSQSGGTATFDHAMGSISNVCVGVIGGSLLTINQAASNLVSNNTIHVQSGTYVVTSTFNGNVNYAIIGYQTTHQDHPTGTNRPLITTATNSTVLFQDPGTTGGTFLASDLQLSNTAGVRERAFWAASGNRNAAIIRNVSMSGFTTAIYGDFAINSTFLSLIVDRVDITCGTNGIVNTTGVVMTNSSIHGCSASGLATGTNGNPGTAIYGIFVTNSIFYNNNIAINWQSAPNTQTQNLNLTGNVFYNSTVDHIKLIVNTGAQFEYVAMNNIFDTAGGWAINTAQAYNNNAVQYNAYRSNTSGITALAFRFTETNPITLTASPFTNPGSGDFSLNNTAGGGALLRAAAAPLALPTTTSALDVGAAQHAGTSAVTVGVPVQ